MCYGQNIKSIKLFIYFFNLNNEKIENWLFTKLKNCSIFYQNEWINSDFLLFQ